MRTLIAVLLIGISSLLHAERLPQHLDQLIAQTLPHANVGVLIEDAATGQVVYSHQADKLFYPASNAKLFAAAAALYQLGKDYQYQTILSKHGNDIYLTFSGAPDLTTEQLKQLLQKLKTANITEINNFILDVGQFSPPDYPAGMSVDDLGWYYAAPSTAIILNGNSLSYKLTAAQEMHAPISITPIKPDQRLVIENNVVTVSKEEAKQHCNLNIDIQPHNKLKLYGCLAQKDKPVIMKFAIPDPQLYAIELIQANLREQGIKLNGQIHIGQKPKDTQIIASQLSKKMTILLAHMLEESDNLYADSITKSLAYAVTGQGTAKQGAYAIKHILMAHIPFDIVQLAIADGVGTRYNLSTPGQLVLLLKNVYNDPKLKTVFMATLPRMGVSGTLKARMKDTPLANQVLAKTGTMHDISSLSGYLVVPNGKTYLFSIISNGIHRNSKAAKELEEKILLAVYKQTNEVPPAA